MQHTLLRRTFLAAAGTTALAGCLGGGGGGGSGGSSSTSTAADGGTTTTTAGSASVSGGPPLADQQLPLMYDLSKLKDEISSGGVPKDGIPSIDSPKFISPKEADQFLNDGDIVFGLAQGDGVKAYPQKILVWHEIVNDSIDGTPISVTYCPLTGTTMGFYRGETTFGTSGRLLNNNLVMYDRDTDTWYSQVLGTGVKGPLTGKSLQEFRVIWTTWSNWKAAYPETKVLSKETGYARNYDSDPYGSYNPKKGHYADKSTMFPPLVDDDRYHPKAVFMGARSRDGAIAFRKTTVRKQDLVTGTVGEVPYLAVHDENLDTVYVYRNPEDQSFSIKNGAIAGPDGKSHSPAALPLERIYTFDAMWFAWIGFYPESVIVA
ncbi:MAG: DUF3179 domain-containing protein [Halobacteriales archaeon]|nr:DUF3179 domain-containing protein [Halobacteriales archaeon]